MNYIEVNGTIILFAGKISFVLNNPMFSNDISYSLQSTAPDDEDGINARAFGYVNRADILDNKTRELPARYKFGAKEFTGTITVKYQNGAFPFYFKITGDFWSAIKDVYIDEIDYGTDTIPAPNDLATFKTFVADANRIDVERKYAMPVVSSRSENKNFDLEFDDLWIINDLILGHAAIAMPYLKFIYANIFEKHGIVVSSNILYSNNFLKFLILPNNYMVQEYEIDYSTVAIGGLVTGISNSKDPEITVYETGGVADKDIVIIYTAEQEWNDLATKFYQVLKTEEGVMTLKNADFSSMPAPFVGNLYPGNAFIYTYKIKTTYNKVVINKHLPHIKIIDFLNELQKTFGIIPFVQNAGVKVDLVKNVLNSLDVIDVSQYSEQIRQIENPDLNGYTLSFKQDSNDEQVKSLLPITDISSFNNIGECDTVNDLSDGLQVNNDVKLVLNQNCWYKFNKASMIGYDLWKFITYNALIFKNNDGDFKIDSNITPLYPGNINALHPQWTDFISTINIDLQNNNFKSEKQLGFRLLNYMGFSTNVGGILQKYYAHGDLIQPEYPINSPFHFPVPDFLLRWDTDKGIINNFLKEYLEWQTNIRKDAKTVIYWPDRYLADFDFSKKYSIGGTNYIVKSIKFSDDFETGTTEHNETELARV